MFAVFRSYVHVLVLLVAGLMGGEAGQLGLNLIITAEGREISLGGKNTYFAETGDRIRILTPGYVLDALNVCMRG